jgi:hypothetical protein
MAAPITIAVAGLTGSSDPAGALVTTTKAVARTVILSSDGRTGTVTGHLTCPEGSPATIDVTIRERGDDATGTWSGTCTGTEQTWTTTVTSEEGLEPGHGSFHAVLETDAPGGPWGGPIDLESAE